MCSLMPHRLMQMLCPVGLDGAPGERFGAARRTKHRAVGARFARSLMRRRLMQMLCPVGLDGAPVSGSALRAEQSTVLLELASLAH